jgi:hypothetical protein
MQLLLLPSVWPWGLAQASAQQLLGPTPTAAGRGWQAVMLLLQVLLAWDLTTSSSSSVVWMSMLLLARHLDQLMTHLTSNTPRTNSSSSRSP